MGCITPQVGIRNGVTVTTILDVILFVVNLVIAVSMMIYGTLFSERQLQSPIMYIGLKMVNFTCYACSIYGLISCFINRHEIWKFYNDTYTIDTMLGALGIRTNFNHSFALFALYYGTVAGAYIVMIGVMARENISWMLLLNLGYTYFSLATLHILSVSCLDAVLMRNVRLNRALQEQLGLEGSDVDPSPPASSNYKQKVVLRQIMQIFDLICDLADKGSFYYGIQIMVSIAGSFVFLLFYTFAFTLVVRSVLPFDSVFRAGPIMSYCLFAYNIFIVAFFGNALKLQGKLTSKLIDKAINSTNNPEMIEMLRMFSMQLYHRSPILTCGLFPFDWTLIFSILSTAATYIIILLQFESAGS